MVVPKAISTFVAMDSKVGLIILGAQKCSTTTLFHLLKNHPQMCASRMKEPNFFIRTKDWRRDISQYEELFEPQPGQILFEASTAYTFYPLRRLQIWEDMYEYNPLLRFIYLVRNPIDRMISSYMHLYLRGYTDLNIHKTLKKECSLLAISRYYTQIIPFIRKFGRDRVLILDVEDLHENRQHALNRVAEFLGIDESGLTDQPVVHRNRSLDNTLVHHKWDNPGRLYNWVRKVSPKTLRKIARMGGRVLPERPELTLAEKKMIIDVLDLEIEHLEKLMGKSLQHWKIIK